MKRAAIVTAAVAAIAGIAVIIERTFLAAPRTFLLN